MLEVLPNHFGHDIGQNLFKIDGELTASFKTFCCALLQLSLDNDSKKEHIEKVLEYLKLQNGRFIGRDSGERAVFVIASIPGEEKLVEMLESVGFKFIYEFHRRKCYNDEETMLQMWIYSW